MDTMVVAVLNSYFAVFFVALAVLGLFGVLPLGFRYLARRYAWLKPWSRRVDVIYTVLVFVVVAAVSEGFVNIYAGTSSGVAFVLVFCGIPALITILYFARVKPAERQKEVDDKFAA